MCWRMESEFVGGEVKTSTHPYLCVCVGWGSAWLCVCRGSDLCKTLNLNVQQVFGCWITPICLSVVLKNYSLPPWSSSGHWKAILHDFAMISIWCTFWVFRQIHVDCPLEIYTLEPAATWQSDALPASSNAYLRTLSLPLQGREMKNQHTVLAITPSRQPAVETVSTLAL